MAAARLGRNRGEPCRNGGHEIVCLDGSTFEVAVSTDDRSARSRGHRRVFRQLDLGARAGLGIDGFVHADQTSDTRILTTAEDVVNCFVANVPANNDYIPPWDFDAPGRNPWTPLRRPSRRTGSHPEYGSREAALRSIPHGRREHMESLSTNYLDHGCWRVCAARWLPGRGWDQDRVIYGDYYFTRRGCDCRTCSTEGPVGCCIARSPNPRPGQCCSSASLA